MAHPCGSPQFINHLSLWQPREGREYDELPWRRWYLGQILKNLHQIKEQKLGARTQQAKGGLCTRTQGEGRFRVLEAVSDCRTAWCGWGGKGPLVRLERQTGEPDC